MGPSLISSAEIAVNSKQFLLFSIKSSVFLIIIGLKNALLFTLDNEIPSI